MYVYKEHRTVIKNENMFEKVCVIALKCLSKQNAQTYEI